MDKFIFLIICVLLGTATAISMYSQESKTPSVGEPILETVTNIAVADRVTPEIEGSFATSETQIATLESGDFEYRAFVKNTRIEDRHDVFPPANIVSISYEADAHQKDLKRPVMFLFNGGPGSSSIWLHMTGFGPKKISADLLYPQDGEVPLEQEDNLGFLIDVADLVFVDPVGTGLSRVISPSRETAFQDLRVDARAMCRFAQNWLQAEGRVGAPVYVVGVSYSTLRAAGMASHPMCKDFRKNLHGLIFVSGLLDMRMRHSRDTTGRISRYPTIAAIAWYRGLVDQSRWPGGRSAYLADIEQYSDTKLGPALLNRHRLTPTETRAIINDVHTRLGMNPPGEQIRTIAAALSNAQNRLDGEDLACSYDARFNCTGGLGPHPDLPLLAFGDELEKELVSQIGDLTGYELQPDNYTVMRGNRFRANWDYRFHKSFESGAGTDMAHTLLRNITPEKPSPITADIGPQSQYTQRPVRNTRSGQSTTRIMVASGLYDLATPYYAMELALLRAGLEPSQFEMHLYEGGHMMYLEKETGYQLAADIRSFVGATERLF